MFSLAFFVETIVQGFVACPVSRVTRHGDSASFLGGLPSSWLRLRGLRSVRGASHGESLALRQGLGATCLLSFVLPSSSRRTGRFERAVQSLLHRSDKLVFHVRGRWGADTVDKLLISIGGSCDGDFLSRGMVQQELMASAMST